MQVYDDAKRALFPYRWPSSFPDHNDYAATTDNIDPSEQTNNHYYHYGDIIQTYREDSKHHSAVIGSLQIPASVANGQHCSIRAPIRFMVDQEIACRRASAAAHAQHFHRLRDQMLRTKISTSLLQYPHRSSSMATTFCAGNDDEWTDAGGHNRTHPKCIPVRLFDCAHRIASDTCRPAAIANMKDTEQRLEIAAVRFEIVHDFRRIHNCSLFFVQAIEDEEAADETTLVRRTSVRFRQLNESLAAHHVVSGNAGYLRGAPIIVSHLRPRDDSNATEGGGDPVLDYFHVNSSASSSASAMRMPHIDAAGNCRLNRNNRSFTEVNDDDAIEFGRDFRIKCYVPLREMLPPEPDSSSSSSDRRPDSAANLTQLCTRLQRILFAFLLPDVRHNYGRNASSSSRSSNGAAPSYVSQLGNPANRTERWVQLRWLDGDDADDQLEDLMSEPATAVSGSQVYENDEDDSNATANAVQAFRCSQMVLNVRFAFGVVRGGSHEQPGARNQWMVHDASIALGPRVDLRFGVDDDDNDDDGWRVPIVLDGHFIDATSAAVHSKWNGLVVGLILMLGDLCKEIY